MSPTILVTLRPLDSTPEPELYEHVLVVPRRGEIIVSRGIAFHVEQVTHFGLSAGCGATIEILVVRLESSLRG